MGYPNGPILGHPQFSQETTAAMTYLVAMLGLCWTYVRPVSGTIYVTFLKSMGI